MARVSAHSIVCSEWGLASYVQKTRRLPLLTPQEEIELATRWREHGDRHASDRLVTSHLRLVVRIAAGYRGYGLPAGEIISEGNLGLMQAVSRFDPDKGFRLATYAMWWIRASIQEHVLRSWSLVRIGTTVQQKRLFFNLRRTKSQISALEDGDLRPEHVMVIARRLSVSEDAVIQMNRRLGGDASLNAPIGMDGDSGDRQDWLVDNAPSQEQMLIETENLDSRRAALREALVALNDRERRIFTARHLADEPSTLEVLAQEFGISPERVRQIEVRSLDTVRKFVRRQNSVEETGRRSEPFWQRAQAAGNPSLNRRASRVPLAEFVR